MAPVRGDSPLPQEPEPADDDESPDATNPLPRMRTVEIEGDDGGDVDSGWNTPSQPAAALATAPEPAMPQPEALPKPSPRSPAASGNFGATFLAHNQPTRMPWMVAAALGVAVLFLIAYIVFK